MKPILLTLIALVSLLNIYPQNLERRLDSLLQGYIDKGKIHGCVAYVVQKGSPLVFKPYGYMDIENKIPMKKDVIFRIASMTKPLTAATALKLYEDGKFLLDDPAKKYIPEFGKLKVLAPGCKSFDSLKTIALERDVTIRDLLRHTAGFGYGGDDIVGRLYETNIPADKAVNLSEFTHALLAAPLKYQPGSKWEYSFANDILGCVIEVISGQPLDKCMNEELLEPLKMKSTGFYVLPENIKRLCNFYAYDKNKLVLVDKASTSLLAYKPVFLSGGGGGVSTAEDYGRFLQMLLNYGDYNGKTIFNKQTVELMTSNQIGEIKDRSFDPGGYGLGIGVKPGQYCGQTQGCYWGGSPYNTTFSIDYKKQMYAILLIQNAPWEHLNLMNDFQKIVSEETKE